MGGGGEMSAEEIQLSEAQVAIVREKVLDPASGFYVTDVEQSAVVSYSYTYIYIQIYLSVYLSV